MGEGRGRSEYDRPYEDSPEKIAEDLGITTEQLRILEEEIALMRRQEQLPVNFEGTDDDIDKLLFTLLELAPEYSPDHRKALRKQVRKLLGLPEISEE